MATRTPLARVAKPAWAAVAEAVTGRMEGMVGRGGRVPRYFSDSTGKVLAEEERAAENVYIQKMEREKLEKLKRKEEKEKLEKVKRKEEKEKAEAAKKAGAKGDRKAEEPQKG